MKKRTAFIALIIFLSVKILQAQPSFSLAPNICKSDTTYLAANTGSMVNCTFTWVCNPSGGSFSTPGNSITSLSFVSTGTFSITLTLSSGTTISSTQNTIISVALPTINLSQTGFTTCITNNNPDFSKPVSLTASGGISYTWNPPHNPIVGNPNGPSTTVRPVSNACFSVTGVDNNGCKAMAITCVTVIPRFTISVTPANTVICQNGIGGPDVFAVLISNNPSSPAFGSSSSHTYSWTGTDILTTPLASTINVAPFATATYTSEIRDSLNCVSLPALVTVSVQNCTDLQDYHHQPLSVSCYPIPVIEKLSIRVHQGLLEKVTVMNLVGQTITVYEDPGAEIDLKTLPRGVYVLMFMSSNSRTIIRIIKN